MNSCPCKVFWGASLGCRWPCGARVLSQQTSLLCVLSVINDGGWERVRCWHQAQGQLPFPGVESALGLCVGSCHGSSPLAKQRPKTSDCKAGVSPPDSRRHFLILYWPSLSLSRGVGFQEVQSTLSSGWKALRASSACQQLLRCLSRIQVYLTHSFCLCSG